MADDKLRITIELDDGTVKRGFAQIQKESAKTGKKIEKDFSSGFAKLTRPLAGIRTQILGIGTAIAGAFAVKGIINASKNIEGLTARFKTLTGNTKVATALLKDLQKFGATTPFELQGISDAAGSLLAFGINADEIIDKIQVIGDVAAGSQQPLKDLAGIYGQIASVGKLTTERLIQLQDRGINLLPALSKQLGKSQNEIRKLITSGEIDLKKFENAFRSLTEQGGIFAGAIERQSKTLGGLLSNLSDNFTQVQTTLGTLFGPLFKAGVNVGIILLEELNDIILDNKDNIIEFFQKDLVGFIDRIKEAGGEVKTFATNIKDLVVIAGISIAVTNLAEAVGKLKIAFNAIDIIAFAGKFKTLGKIVNPTTLALTGLIAGAKGLIDGFKKLEEERAAEGVEGQIARLNEELKIQTTLFNKLQGEQDGFLDKFIAGRRLPGVIERISQIKAELEKLKVVRDNTFVGPPEPEVAAKGEEETLSVFDRIKNAIREGIDSLGESDDEEGGTILDKLKPDPAKTEEVKQDYLNLFGFLKIQFDNTAKTLENTGKQIASQFKGGVVRGIAGGVQNIVNSLVNGENAFKNFGIFVLQVIGDLAIQLGTTLIAAGIGIESLKALGGAAAVAAGIALVAVGTLIKSFVGGGVDTAPLSGGGGGSFASPTQDDEITSVADEEERQAATVINANILGPVVGTDRETAGLALVDLLDEQFRENGVEVRKGSFA